MWRPESENSGILKSAIAKEEHPGKRAVKHFLVHAYTYGQMAFVKRWFPGKRALACYTCGLSRPMEGQTA